MHTRAGCTRSVICVLLLMLWHGSSVLARADEPLSGEDLAALMHAQVSGIHALWFRSDSYRREGDSEAGFEQRDFSRAECAFRVDGVAITQRTSWWTDDDDGEEMHEEIHQLWKDGLESLYNVTQRAGMVRPRVVRSTPQTEIYYGLGLSVPPMLGGVGLHELVETEGVGIERLEDDDAGRPRIRLDIPPSHPEIKRYGGHIEAYLDITLDPEAGYAPVLVATYDNMLNFRWGVIQILRHKLHFGMWVPEIIEIEDWMPDFLHPQGEHFPALVDAALKRGIDLMAEMTGDVPDDLADPGRHRRIRGALQEVFPEGLPEGRSEGRRSLVVTEVLGVNDGVPDSVFESPFPEGVEVYDTRDMQTYIVREGELVRAPRADHDKK